MCHCVWVNISSLGWMWASLKDEQLWILRLSFSSWNSYILHRSWVLCGMQFRSIAWNDQTYSELHNSSLFILYVDLTKCWFVFFFKKWLHNYGSLIAKEHSHIFMVFVTIATLDLEVYPSAYCLHFSPCVNHMPWDIGFHCHIS